ncbi:MAG: hypothetical protein AAFW69_09970 [Pseudomonadota bacterium]
MTNTTESRKPRKSNGVELKARDPLGIFEGGVSVNERRMRRKVRRASDRLVDRIARFFSRMFSRI